MTNAEAGKPAPPAFNLLDERWLPVRLCDGRLVEVGLLELFRSSRDIEGLAEPSPPSFVALHRLLLTITHRALTRALGRWSTAHRAHWYDQGLPVQGIVDYLEHWRERFWVFHPTVPFMQVAALERYEATKHRTKPWTQVTIGCSVGDAPVLFDHSVDASAVAVPWAIALRSLLGFLQFVPPGLIQVLRTSDRQGPLANTAAFLPVGRNLSETLTLCLHPSGLEDDRPTWELPPFAVEELQLPPLPPSGPNDRYTRLTRSCLLHLTRTGDQVGNLLFAAGRALTSDDMTADPFTATIGLARDQSRRSIRFVEGRAIWRDLSSLLPLAGRADSAMPAATMEWAIAIDRPFEVIAGGLAAGHKPAKLVRWRLERFALPLQVAGAEHCVVAIRDHLANAERTFSRLKIAAVELIHERWPRESSAERDADALKTVDSGPLEAAFFSALERGLPSLFRELRNENYEQAFRYWAQSLLTAVREGWLAQTSVLGSGVATLRAMALVDRRISWLQRELSASAELGTSDVLTEAQ